jgi:hypothetical protein
LMWNRGAGFVYPSGLKVTRLSRATEVPNLPGVFLHLAAGSHA